MKRPHLNPSELFKAPLPILLVRAFLCKHLNIIEHHLPAAPHGGDHIALVQLGGDLALLVLDVGGEQILARLVVHHVRSLQLVDAPPLPQYRLQHSGGRHRSPDSRPVVKPELGVCASAPAMSSWVRHGNTDSASWRRAASSARSTCS